MASTPADAFRSVVTHDRYEIVIVSYHSRDQVAGLLESVATQESRIVLVDNASGADNIAELLTSFPRSRYIDGRNSGFAAAANAGALSSDAEFVIFANPDSRPTPATCQALLAELDADAGLSVAAAATVGPDGEIEVGVGGWEPTVRRCLVHAAGLHKQFRTAGVYAWPRPGAPTPVEWVTGACMAVRRSDFARLGGFDERYFVYNEDMAYGRAVRLAGLRQVLRTDVLVPHAAGSSGGGSTKMPQQRGASMAAYLHDHNPAARAVAMRAALAVGMAGRVVLTAATGDRETARRHAAYVRGIVTRRSPYVRGAS